MPASDAESAANPDANPVLILGAGINGAALARELVLNGVGCWIVDKNDIAFGATSRSSRLIHGGLRYLEYGDFHLVRESLSEREILRKVAPQFVEPLRLDIPVAYRTGGLMQSGFRFLGSGRSPWINSIASKVVQRGPRGLWLVQAGLRMYDYFASSADFPKYSVRPVSNGTAPRVDSAKYQWLCGYYDAQMRYPERFVLALLEDARRIAEEQKIEFRIVTHHQAAVIGEQIYLCLPNDGLPVKSMNPSLIVNATGAWGDLTLKSLPVNSPPQFGPTKGSHFVSHAPRFREALGNGGVYAEADDGRLIFVLPFGKSVLVGTTDERFEQDPSLAVATKPELDYLLDLVNDLFPTVQLTEADIDVHYSGVRPLPRQDTSATSAISRDHAIVESQAGKLPVLTLVGGKLTTARAFGALAADAVLQKLSLWRRRSSEMRIVPGGENFPADAKGVLTEQERIRIKFELEAATVEAVWSLVGMRSEEILRTALAGADAASANSKRTSIAGTSLPRGFVDWVIRHEWVETLDDLIDRRLMLLFEPNLSEQTVRELAACMADAERITPYQQDAIATETIERLQREHGMRFGLLSTKALGKS